MITTRQMFRFSLVMGWIFPMTMLLPPSQAAANEPPCGEEIREEVVKYLDASQYLSDEEQLKWEAEIYEKYQACSRYSSRSAKNLNNVARACGARVSALGNIYYEEMGCCGYDPQRRQFTCPVTIKRGSGFGGAPLPGSRLHVLHCVAGTSGNLVPVGEDSVHIADEMHGAGPIWMFAVTANANRNLALLQPMDGQTRKARSILSWQLRPTSCDYQPIWGNAINYRIRLDQ